MVKWLIPTPRISPCKPHARNDSFGHLRSKIMPPKCPALNSGSEFQVLWGLGSRRSDYVRDNFQPQCNLILQDNLEPRDLTPGVLLPIFGYISSSPEINFLKSYPLSKVHNNLKLWSNSVRQRAESWGMRRRNRFQIRHISFEVAGWGLVARLNRSSLQIKVRS